MIKMEPVRGCAFLTDIDHAQLCEVLNLQVDGLRSLPLVTGLLTFLAGLVVALITFYGNRTSQRTERHHKAQRDALRQAQDIALKLRNLWITTGQSTNQVSKDMESAENKLTKTHGEFATKISRLDSDHLRRDYVEWSRYAEQYFQGSPEHEGYREQELWDRALECSGNKLRGLDK